MKALKFDSKTFYENNPEWFAFETRLRDLMLGIIEPIIRKSLHDTTHVAKVMHNQDYQKQKVDEFEFFVQKMLKKQGSQDDLQRSIKEYEKRTTNKESELMAVILDSKKIKDDVSNIFSSVQAER